MSAVLERKNTDRTARDAVAEHIAVELSRIARVAGANDFELLAYLIDMAVLEAWREASEGTDGRGRVVRR